MYRPFIISTDALAQGKEGAITVQPEREKPPLAFYLEGEQKTGVVYASLYNGEESLTISFYGLETPKNLRGMNLKVSISRKEKVLKVRTNFDTLLSEKLFRKFWPGGPYSFLKAISVIEFQILGSFTGYEPWVERFLFHGGLNTIPEKRLSFYSLFEIGDAIFK